MTEIKPKYDLESRTYEFALRTRNLTRNLRMLNANKEYVPQLVRSTGSVAANYIEANEALSGKDFVNRVKICRKEAKESYLWLKLLEVKSNCEDNERAKLISESKELVLIFNSIIKKSGSR